jgi:uncharacterized membrane protein
VNPSIPSPSPSGLDRDAAGEARPRIGWFPAVLVGILAFLVVAWIAASESGWGPWKATGAQFPVLWPLIPFGFFGLVLAIFVLVRFVWWGRGWGAGRYWHDGASAREIVRERYARDEITRDRLRQMMADLDES